jgi:Acyl-CoA hydrolase
MAMEKESIEVVTAQLVLPPNTNHYGTIFGGKLVELMDMAGALAAMRFANEEVVTASIEAIDFKMPIKQGDLVELKSNVIYTT